MGKLGPIIGGMVFGVLGFGGAIYSKYAAQAAVEVRPDLAEVGFVTAALSQHGGDWLYYHYPIASIIVTTLFFVMFGVLFGAINS